MRELLADHRVLFDAIVLDNLMPGAAGAALALQAKAKKIPGDVLALPLERGHGFRQH